MSNRLAATPSFISKLVGPCIRMTFNRITVLLTVLTIVTFSQLSLSRQNNLLLRDAPELPTIDQKDAFFRSQAGQDRWIFENLMASNVEDVRNRGGFFIEFGARDGAEHSNTYFFEHFLGWNGLLIEASPSELGNILQNTFFSCAARFLPKTVVALSFLFPPFPSRCPSAIWNSTPIPITGASTVAVRFPTLSCPSSSPQ